MLTIEGVVNHGSNNTSYIGVSRREVVGTTVVDSLAIDIPVGEELLDNKWCPNRSVSRGMRCYQSTAHASSANSSSSRRIDRVKEIMERHL